MSVLRVPAPVSPVRRCACHDAARPVREVPDAALTAVLDAFAATVAGAFTPHTVLTQLVEAAVTVLAVDGAGVMVADDDSLLRFAHADGSRRTAVVQAGQAQELLQDGPCRDSHRTGRVVTVDDLMTEGSWPGYQAQVAGLGLRSVTAIPLRARGRSWGVLDLYRSRPLGAQEMAAARTLANLATSYLVISADRDATDRAQVELARRAMYDPLTDLPVRWVLLEQLTRSLVRLARRGDQVAVLFIDLDGLKYVNDTYGHAAGDDLLTTCARRIRASLRPSDLVARVGGDEFVVLLEDLTTPAEATAVASRVLAELSAPHQVGPHTTAPSASIGLAMTADAGMSAEALVAHADSAMYRAKRGGRGRVDVFDAADYEQHRAEATTCDRLLPALRAALGEDQLELHYQPIHDLTSRSTTGTGGRVHAVEALLRWRRPQHGLLSAAEFMPAAERTGLVLDLGAWVVQTACEQLVAWDAELGGRSPRHVFVNISARELADPALAAQVHQSLRSTGLGPERLVLEVTETSVFTDPETVSSNVRALVALGCSLAIDDFGTGYSSLRRMVDVPATTLKVDRSFTRDLATNPAAAAVITAALQLGRALDRTVVIEGVEDASTLQALVDLGATHFQGYHLTRPAPADQLTPLLR